MSMETFETAAKLCEHLELGLFIGGGEPTLHPRFWDIVGCTMRYNAAWALNSGTPAVGLVTNGSQTETALALARLSETGQASVRLSRDQFHRPYHIDERVIAAFKKPRKFGDDGYARSDRENDRRDIGGEISNILPVGRAKRNGWTTGLWDSKGCDACGPMVTPDGSIWRCSCRKEKLGTVYKPADVEYDVLASIDAGCTVNDGKLVADPTRDGELRTRKSMEDEGWLLKGGVAVRRDADVKRGIFDHPVETELREDAKHE